MLAAFAGAIGIAACGSSSSSPASPSDNTNPALGKFQTNGRLIDALTGASVAGVTAVTTDTRQTYATATDANGQFTLGVDTSASAGIGFVFSGPSIVTRQTVVKVPGNAPTITVLAKTFDLVSFDQMCRTPMLTRWTSAPPLTVQTQVLQFTNINDSQFPASSETMSGADVNSITADLSWGLPQMSGGQFAAFAGTSNATSASGATVTMLTNGRITVGRFAGLRAAAGAVGFSRWEIQADGTVVSGLIMLDRDFDMSGAANVRAVRTHELGHTMGYNHVLSRPSVMNAIAEIEPNAADLADAKVAFLRPPGNKSPDTDPTGFSTNSLKRTWTLAIR